MSDQANELETLSQGKYEIPEEVVIDQRTIIFLDDDLTVALGESGNIYCSLPGMCRALGLIQAGQTRRIIDTKLLRPGLVYMRLKTPKRGIQKTTCFRIDLIASWLIGAETGNMRPEAAAKIDEYQTRLAPTAMHVFLDVMGISPRNLLPAPTQPQLPTTQSATSEEVAELRQQYLDLLGTVNLMRESLEAMANSLGDKLDDALDMMRHILSTQSQQGQEIDHIKTKTRGLTSAQKQQVAFAVKTIVKDSGKTSYPRTYAHIHGAIQSHFHVNSYADIPEEHYEAVMAFLREMWRHIIKGEQPEQGNLF
jgi:hypothetical protein